MVSYLNNDSHKIDGRFSDRNIEMKHVLKRNLNDYSNNLMKFNLFYNTITNEQIKY